MTDPPEARPSIVDTLEARSRELGEPRSGPPAPGSPRAAGGDDGCLKGCLLGCGCLTLVVIAVLVASVFGVDRWLDRYILSPTPAEFEVLPPLTGADLEAAETKRHDLDRATVLGLPVEMTLSEADVNHIARVQLEDAQLAGAMRVRFPEPDVIEAELTIPAFGDHINLDLRAQVRVEGGSLTSSVERVRLRETDQDDVGLEVADQMLRDMLLSAQMSGLGRFVVVPGAVEVSWKPGSPAVVVGPVDPSTVPPAPPAGPDRHVGDRPEATRADPSAAPTAPGEASVPPPEPPATNAVEDAA